MKTNVSFLYAIILAVLLFQIGLRGVQSSDVQSEAPDIDLEENTWLIRSGFTEENSKGLDAKAEGVLVKQSTPVVLPALIPPTAGEKINHYTVSTEFFLDEDSLDFPLGLYLAWIGESWRVYLNGHLVRDEMFIADNEITRMKTMRGLWVEFPRRFLRQGTNTLTFHMAGYAAPMRFWKNTDLGLIYNGPYRVTTYSNLDKPLYEKIDLILASLYLFFGLYHLVMYLFRRVELYNLFFAVFLIALSIDGFSKTMLIGEIISDSRWIIRFKHASQALLVPAAGMFLFYFFFPERSRTVLLRFINGIGIGIVLAFLFAPYTYYLFFLEIFHVAALIALFYYSWIMISSVLKKKEDSGRMLFASLFTVLSALWDILDDHLFNTGVRLMKYGFFSYVMSMVFILAIRFVRVHNRSEKLNTELEDQRNSFSRFVPREFLQLLERESAQHIHLGDSSQRKMTVMFSDIRGFTSISEQMDPAENLSLLNDYLHRIVPEIEGSSGFIDKYLGDGIMSLFEDSQKGGKTIGSSEGAVRAAIAIQKKLIEYNKERQNSGKPPLNTGIGITTGPLILGTIGTEERLDTTVIGDTVNMASRLQDLTKVYGTRILISDETHREIDDADDILMREIATIRVKGKKKPVIVYEVYNADEKEIREAKRETAEIFALSLVLYKGREFSQSAENLREILRRHPGDSIVRYYLNKCEQYMENPPGENWMGIVESIRSKT